MGIILLLLALLLIPALISERKNELYQAQEPERLKQHQARFYCHICGKPSPRPSGYWDQDGENGHLYSEFFVIDYNEPTELVRCARCQNWTCSNADPPHLENEVCKKCLENTPDMCGKTNDSAQHSVHADPAPLRLAGQAGWIRTAKMAFFMALGFFRFGSESRPASRR